MVNMAAFIAVASACILVALGVVLRPLWRQAPRFALACVVLLGVGTFVLYRLVGTPAALEPQNLHAASPGNLQEAVAELRAALQRDPRQVEGWMLLGRALAGQQKFAEAAEAYGKAVQLQPDQPEVLVSAAQARMLAADGQPADATAQAWLRHALALQPEHQRARWFLGVAQRQGGQPAEAAQTWTPLLGQVDGGTRASLLTQINQARAEAQLPPLAEDVATAAATQGPHALAVAVALDPDFAARVRLRGDASVFVIARIPGGPPMPVAVQKHSLQDLPLHVTLGDGDSPMPTAKLSTLDEVELVARLSTSGEAMRQEGDLESTPVRVRLPASAPVELVIGR